jgi:hypothetical protein
MKKPRFKPENGARRADYEIREYTLAPCAAFIREHHYAGGCSNTAVMSAGMFRSGVMVGAALWLPPTRVCAETVDRGEWRRVLSLSRLAVAPGEPQNAASILIGWCVRSLRGAGKWSHLVTFADESQGHTGTIYRATGWTYVGRTKPLARWVDADGRQVSRLATKSRTAAEMIALGYRVQGKFAKHKFTMCLSGSNRMPFAPAQGSLLDLLAGQVTPDDDSP